MTLRTTLFFYRDSRLALTVALLDDGFITRVTTDGRVRFPHAVGPAGRSDAGFIADLGCACRRANHCRTCKRGCEGQRIGCPHLGLQLVASLVMPTQEGRVRSRVPKDFN